MKRTFFPDYQERVLQEELFPFTIKIHMFLLEKVLWNVPNVCYGPVEYELFRFQLISINCEIVLTHWIFFYVMNVLWFISMKFPHWVMKVLIDNKLSCCLYFYWCSCVLKQITTMCDFSYCMRWNTLLTVKW